MHTNQIIQQLDDREFLAQFENKSLDPSYFNHIGHLRLAWLFLSNDDVDSAIQRISSGIQAYAESLGATTKFHATITDSIARIMASRMEAMPQENWVLFLEHNSDLVYDALSLLYQQFSKDMLFSEESRISLVQPDIKPL